VTRVGVGRKGVIGVGGGRDRSVVLNPGDVERMGFDFDEFDAGIVEGTSEAERNPWDLVVDPETGELVERGALGRSSGLIALLEASLGAAEARQGAWVDVRNAVGSYVANVEGFDWGDMATVEEMADQISHDISSETDWFPPGRDRQDYINDSVWTEIIQAGEHAGYEYDLGEFVRFVPGGSSVSEFQATPALTGLGGFQSPGMSSGPPGFQSPGVPSGVLGGSSVRLPVSPPSVRRQSLPAGSPGFGVPDGLLRDLVSRMGGEPPRIGRQNPESSRDGRERGGDFVPGAPLSDEQRRINQRGLEEARDVLRGLGGSVGDMPLEHKLALAAALAGAGLLTVGTGGFAGPALMAGGGLSLLSNQ